MSSSPLTSETTFRRASARWLLALLPLLVTLGAAWLGWSFSSVQRLDVGAPTDALYVEGFYDREQLEGRSYRWSKTDAVVRLPALRAPALIVLHMAGRPGGVPLALDVEGRRLPPFDVKGLELRRYQVLMPPGGGADMLRVVLGAEALRTPQDARQLAVLVESVEVRALEGAADPPPLVPLLSLVAVALALWAGLRLAGLGQLTAGAAALAVGCALALLWASARLFVGPYLPATALGALLVAGLLAALRWGGRRAPLDAAQLLGCLAAGAGLAGVALLLAGRVEPGRAVALVALLPLGLALVALRRQRAVLGGLVLLSAIAAAALLQAPVLSQSPPGSEFHALHRAASRLWYGTLPLYNTAALESNLFANTFTAPPPLAVLALPMVALPYPPALLAWRALSVALLLAAGGLLLRAYRLPLRSWPAAGLLLLLALGSLHAALEAGTAAPLLLVLLAAGLLSLNRGHELALGACLGAAAAISPPLLLLAGFALFQRRWRALGAAVVTVALATAAAILVAGPGVYGVYITKIAAQLATSTSWPTNQSLHGFVHRLFAPDQLALRPAEGTQAQAVAFGLALGLLALTAWLGRRSGLRPDLSLGLWVVAALLAAPVTWAASYTLLALPLFQGFVLAHRPEGAQLEHDGVDGEMGAAPAGLPWTAAVCCTLAFLLLAWVQPGVWYDGVQRGPFWQLLLSAQLYGAALLYAALALGGFAAAEAVFGRAAPRAEERRPEPRGRAASA